MFLQTQNNWVKVMAAMLIYLVLSFGIGMFTEQDPLSSKQILKTLVGGLVGGFYFAMLLLPENPFKKKKNQTH
jgi:hypothetical protein